jgi:transcriptional regulator with XRE-family HTH domain
MGDVIDEHLGNRLVRRRRALGLTQQQVAESIGVRFQQVHKYECGLSRISPARLWDIARALDVSVAYFFDGLGEGAGRPLHNGLGRPLDDRSMV